MPIRTCVRVTVSSKCCYLHRDVQLHTLISYLLLSIPMTTCIADSNFIFHNTSNYYAFVFYAAPSAPLNLTFPPGGVLNDSITLTWSTPQHPNGVIHFYQLQLLSSGGEVLVNTTTDTTTIVLSDLTPGTQYNVSVRAFTVAFGPFGDQLSVWTADGKDTCCCTRKEESALLNMY